MHFSIFQAVSNRNKFLAGYRLHLNQAGSVTYFTGYGIHIIILQICYEWDISNLCREGDNTIVVEVANTPARDARKAFSPFGPECELMEPAGMFGSIQRLDEWE